MSYTILDTSDTSSGASGSGMSTSDLAINLARAIGQGLTFGFADEAEGFARSVLGDETYEEARDSARAGLEQFREEMPVTAYGAEIAASIPSALVGGAGLAGLGARAGSKLLGSKVGQAAAMGGGYGAGVAEEIEDVPTQAAIGAGLGAGFQKITPQVTEQAKKLIKRGVPLTLGQATGGGIKRFEEAMSSVPLAGDVIRSARQRASEAYNTEVVNEALKPLGKNIPKGLTGSDAYEKADDIVSNEYKKIVPKLGIDFGFNAKEFTNRFSNKLRKEELTALNRIVQSELIDRVKDGKLTGQALKDAQSGIRTKAFNFLGSSGYERELGQALQEVSLDISERIAKQTPTLADPLKKADTAYSRLMTIRKATIAAEADEGVFTPAQLQRAIKRDAKGQDRRLATGQMPLQELARAGRATLPAQLPDSGTATRGIVANAALAAAGGAPFGLPIESALLGGGLSALYTSPAQRALRTVVPRAGQALRLPATAGLLTQPAMEAFDDTYTTPQGQRYGIRGGGSSYTLLGE